MSRHATPSLSFHTLFLFLLITILVSITDSCDPSRVPVTGIGARPILPFDPSCGHFLQQDDGTTLICPTLEHPVLHVAWNNQPDTIIAARVDIVYTDGTTPMTTGAWKPTTGTTSGAVRKNFALVPHSAPKVLVTFNANGASKVKHTTRTSVEVKIIVHTRDDEGCVTTSDPVTISLDDNADCLRNRFKPINNGGSEALQVLTFGGRVVSWGQLGDSLAPQNAAYSQFSYYLKLGNTYVPNKYVEGSLASNVVRLYRAKGAWGALKSSGQCMGWGMPGIGRWSIGDPEYAGTPGSCPDSPRNASPDEELFWTRGSTKYRCFTHFIAQKMNSNVVDVVNNGDSMCVLKASGAVVCWGNVAHGGYEGRTYTASGLSPTGEFQNELTEGVIKIVPGSSAFCAIKLNGDTICWGQITKGGIGVIERGTPDGPKIIDIKFFEFDDVNGVALRDDGSLRKIGNLLGYFTTFNFGSYGLQNKFFTTIMSGERTMVAWNKNVPIIDSTNPETDSDGNIIGSNQGGVVYAYGYQLQGYFTNVVQVVLATDGATEAIAVLKSDGTIEVGSSGNGPAADMGVPSGSGRCSRGTGYRKLFSNGLAFAALRQDGSVCSWGDANYASMWMNTGTDVYPL